MQKNWIWDFQCLHFDKIEISTSFLTLNPYIKIYIRYGTIFKSFFLQPSTSIQKIRNIKRQIREKSTKYPLFQHIVHIVFSWKWTSLRSYTQQIPLDPWIKIFTDITSYSNYAPSIALYHRISQKYLMSGFWWCPCLLSLRDP